MNDRKETILTKTPVALLNEALKAINQAILIKSNKSYLLKNASALNRIIAVIYHYAHYKLPLYEQNDLRFEIISKENLEAISPLCCPLLVEGKTKFTVQRFNDLTNWIYVLMHKLSHPSVLIKLLDKIKKTDTDLTTQLQVLFALDTVHEIRLQLLAASSKTVVTDVSSNNNNEFDIKNIPAEIWIEIISHAGKNLLSLMLTCKYFNDLFKKEQLWKAVLENNSPGTALVRFDRAHINNYHFEQKEPVSKRKFRAFFEDIEEVNFNRCYVALEVSFAADIERSSLYSAEFINDYFRSNKDFDKILKFSKALLINTSRREAHCLTTYDLYSKIFILGLNIPLKVLKDYEEQCKRDESHEIQNLRQYIFEITVKTGIFPAKKWITPVRYLEDQDILVEVEKPEFKVSKRL